jgi:cell division protein FtsZ
MSDKHKPSFAFDAESHDIAKIRVIGVGGGGGNAINNMISKGLTNVEYVALNTDAQALKTNKADVLIQVGTALTGGLGAGARPEIGREAVEENRHEIEEKIEGADMVFVTAGMGGGTGTGGAPIVANIAKRKGILTVAVVTTPFTCEGRVRMKYALEGINELKKTCDTVIVIPNEKLFDISDEDTTLMDAFDLANEVLYNATRGISDLILNPGLINLDFADVRTTMQDGGAAIMGSAVAKGPDRAEIAAREALNSPLLDGVSIRGARNVLVNISAGADLKMRETTTATRIIQQEAGDEAEIIMGTVLDESYGEDIRITVIATGFEVSIDNRQNKLNTTATNQRASAYVPVENPLGRVEVRRDMDIVNTVSEAITDDTVASATTSSVSIPTAEDRPRRVENNPFTTRYKGEQNLRNLDSPAIHRRETLLLRKEEPAAESEVQEVSMTGTDNARTTRNILLNNREERIDKSNSDQPAFLRKVMD